MPEVVNPWDGIAIKADGVTVRNNKVKGSGPFSEWTAPTGAGISAMVCDDVTVEGNHIEGTTGAGIWLACTNSLIKENRSEDTQYTGILLAPWAGTGCSGNLIAGNRVHRAGSEWNYDDGIRLGALAHNNVVWKNDVKNASRSGVRAHWNTVHDNTIVANNIQHSKGLGTGYDAYDQSSGTRTAGTANWWVGNNGKTENPVGLLN